MKPFLFFCTLALCAQPTMIMAHDHQGGFVAGRPANGNIVSAPHHGENLRNHSGACGWNELDANERAKMWPTMSARHREYHWRLLTEEERKELRSRLTPDQVRELRQRFVSGHQQKNSHKTVVLYKRLSKEELQLLKEQIVQAQRQQIISNLTKTPATEEEQNKLLASLKQTNEKNHQMLILTIKAQKQEKGATTDLKTGEEQPQSTNSKVVPIDLAPKTPASELNP